MRQYTALNGRFREAVNLMSVPHDEMHAFTEWFDDDAIVVFSFMPKGEPDRFVLDCHFAANKQAMRRVDGKTRVETAINEFCEMMLELLPCCVGFQAVTNKSGVKKLISRCGFKDNERQKTDVEILTRFRDEHSK